MSMQRFRCFISTAIWVLLSGLLLMWSGARAADPAPVDPSTVQVLRSALSVPGQGDHFPLEQTTKNAVRTVSLPDAWWLSRPRQGGPVWYRVAFDAPSNPKVLTAAYLERVCSNAQVYLNGSIVYSGGSMSEPVTRNCYYPQLITLPAGLLLAHGNTLDIKLQGYVLQQVVSRQRAGGLSEIRIGPYDLLAGEYDSRLFWNISVVQISTFAVAVGALFMLCLGWMSRREASLMYFGLATMTWVLLTTRVWVREMPFDNSTVEFFACLGFAAFTALVVQFLLAYGGLRSRVIEICLLMQCLLVPMTLALAGANRMFDVSSVWYLLMAVESVAMIALYLYTIRRVQREELWLMALVLSITGVLVLIEIAVQYNLLAPMRVHVLHLAMPMTFFVIAARQLRTFARAMRAAEASLSTLESRVAAATAEVERNYAQMAELRVEQVTEKERKRIAGDLHDDLGAKLLTIVHTSESERISTLAREALEEMRLSVRGLTGKPLPVADALADWRAETVLRLGQAGIEADWRSPHEDVTQQLSARAFVQTTRILREAVSNVIKHSGASHCKVRCTIGEQDFALVVQDNGQGIPMELDGKLDRGHGMASMKHRAKQMQGQCLVESGPGYGTVIRLTLPL